MIDPAIISEFKKLLLNSIAKEGRIARDGTPGDYFTAILPDMSPDVALEDNTQLSDAIIQSGILYEASEGSLRERSTVSARDFTEAVLDYESALSIRPDRALANCEHRERCLKSGIKCHGFAPTGSEIALFYSSAFTIHLRKSGGALPFELDEVQYGKEGGIRRWSCELAVPMCCKVLDRKYFRFYEIKEV